MRKLIIPFCLILLTSISLFAQKKGLNYQAVIIDPNPIEVPGFAVTGQPLNKGKVTIRFTIRSSAGVDYAEIQNLTTDEFGLVNTTIGTGIVQGTVGSTSANGIKYATFDAIVWDADLKSLIVAVSFDNGQKFTEISNQKLNFTPYALYAESVDYKNVRDSPTNLSQFKNDAGYLIPKDLDPLKQDIAKNSASIEANQKATEEKFLVTEQSISLLDEKIATNTKDINSINGTLVEHDSRLKANAAKISSTESTLSSRIGFVQSLSENNQNAINNLSGSYESITNKSTNTDLGAANPSDQLYPTQKATKTYVDNTIYAAVGSGVPDATTLAAGKVKLSGDLGGTAMSPSVPGLALKENLANKSIDVQTDGNSNTKYPTVKAVKDYVDQATMGTALQASLDAKADKASPTLTGVPLAPTAAPNTNNTQIATTAFVQQALIAGVVDATSTVKGKIALTQDLGGTADSPTVPGLLLKENLANKSDNTSLGTSTSLYPTQNAVKVYVDNQVSSATIADATDLVKGKIQLGGDLNGTGSSATSPIISNNAITSAKIANLAVTDAKINSVAASKITGVVDIINGGTGASTTTNALTNLGAQSAANLSTDISGDANSTIKYPAVKSIKEYVDVAVAAATIADATTSIKGKMQLGGDLAGTGTTAAAPIISDNAITTIKIGDAQVTTNKIADAQVTTAKIADAQVTTAKLVDNAVTTGKITDANVTTAKIAPNAIVEGKIANGAITNSKIADATILNAKFGEAVSIANGGTGSTTAATALSALGAQATANLSTNISTDANSTEKYPAVKTIKEYVDNRFSSATIVDATTSVKGKIQLGGDLAGTGTTADAPIITNAAVTTAKIADENVTTGKLAANAVTTAKIADANVTTAKLADASVTNAKIAETISISNGGTGSTTKNFVDLTNAQTIAGTKTFSSTISGDISGNAATATTLATARSIYGNNFDGSAALTGIIASTYGGTGNGFTKFTGPTSSEKTYTLPDASTTILTTNAAVTIAQGGTGSTTAGAALTALGAQATANLSTNMTTDALSEVKYPAVKTVKDYIDASVTSGAPDADANTKGKIQLAGDLTGTAASPEVATNAITSAKIKDGEIVNADISSSAAIVDTKLATLSTSGKVRNSATTATSANTGFAIVARDTLGNFSAGTISANLTGLASRASHINGGNIGDMPFQSTANTTALLAGSTSPNKHFLTQTGNGSTSAPPMWARIQSADITDLGSGVSSFLTNPSSSNFASLISTKTGTGVLVFNSSPTLFSPTIGTANATSITFAGASTSTGTATLLAPILPNQVTITLPAETGTLATLDGTETLTNKSLVSPVLTTPALGTPASGVLTNATGLPLTTGVTGTLPIANGGTGATTASTALTALGAQAVANLSTNITTDSASTSKYPAVKTIKDYVDTRISSASIADATSSVKGKIQLGGDLAGTSSSAAAPVITNNAITTVKIADANVTTGKLADNAVTTAKITDANVTTSKLADASVTNAKLDKSNIPLSGFGAAAAHVAMGAFKITDVANPTNAQDVATKNYIDSTAGNYVDLTTNQNINGLKTFISDDGFIATGNSGVGNASSLAIGTRMMWYPKRSAFRVGNLSGDDQEIGNFSFAAGNEAKASAETTIAIGFKAEATASGAFAIGGETKASGEFATALGRRSEATRGYAFAGGYLAKATGEASTAFGSETQASDSFAFAAGYKSIASGSASTALGAETEANQAFSFAAGYKSKASGNASTALGAETEANQAFAFAAGYKTLASGAYSTAIGSETVANQAFAFAAGYKTLASGAYSTAIGGETEASQVYTFAAGFKSIASGAYSVAVGQESIASSNHTFASGYLTKASGSYTTAMGQESEATSSHAFAAGYKNLASGSSSFAMGQESQATSTNAFAAGYKTLASGSASIAMGSETQATQSNAFAIGYKSIASGSPSIAMGSETQATQINAFAVGYKSEASGSSSIAMGTETIASQSSAFATGYKSAASGINSTAMGDQTQASQSSAFAVGRMTVASGTNSTAMGDQTQASQSSAFAVGYMTVASGVNSTAMGDQTQASQSSAFAVGYMTEASGVNSTAMGDQTDASGSGSFAIGGLTQATAANAFASGNETIASGANTSAFGYKSEANGDHSVAIGTGVKAGSFSEIAIGTYNTNPTAASTSVIDTTDRLFVIGNGTDANTLSDAVIVLKNGNTRINGTLTAKGLTYPTSDGTAGQVLTTDGSGALSFSTISSGGVSSLADIGNTANAKGASISGTTLTLQPADGTYGGVVTTGTQTFAGAKSFSNTTASSSTTTGAVIVGGGVGIAGALNVGGNTAITGTIKIAGGTPGLGKVLTSDADGLASWASPSGITTLSTIGSTANGNGATISGSTLNLQPASADFGGVVTTGTQTFAGAKTFS